MYKFIGLLFLFALASCSRGTGEREDYYRDGYWDNDGYYYRRGDHGRHHHGHHEKHHDHHGEHHKEGHHEGHHDGGGDHHHGGHDGKGHH